MKDIVLKYPCYYHNKQIVLLCVCVCVANQTKKKDFPFCNRNVENWKQKMYSRNFGLEFEERPKREERRYKGRLNERLRFRVEG